MAEVTKPSGPEATGTKKSRGANPAVDYKALFQKSKDKYDRVSSDHSDIVANISRASAKQVKLREELDWLLDSIATRREKVRAAAAAAAQEAEEHARATHRDQHYRYSERDPYQEQYASYSRSYPPQADSVYQPPPPPVRAIDPYADHVPPPPFASHDPYYRHAYAAAPRHAYRPRSASRSPPPRTHAIPHSSPRGNEAVSSKRPRPPSEDPLEPKQEHWAPEHKRARND